MCGSRLAAEAGPHPLPRSVTRSPESRVGLAFCMQIHTKHTSARGLVQDFMYASCMLCMLEKMGTFKGVRAPGGAAPLRPTPALEHRAASRKCAEAGLTLRKNEKKTGWCAIRPPAAAEAPASFSGLRCDQSAWNYPLAMPWAAATAAALTAADIALDVSRGGAEGHTKHTRRKAQKVVILYAACMLLYALVCTGIFSIHNTSPTQE